MSGLNQTLTSPDELKLTYDTLRVAQGIAAQRWRQRECDVHRCLLLAWERLGTDSPVPFAALMGACRALVPDGQLLAWNEEPGRCRDHVTALLGRAARGLIARNVA